MYEIYEPHELERAGLTAEDNKIRNQDIPERMQLRSVPVTSADDEELDEEAEWIHKVAFFDRVAQAQKEQSQNVPETAVPFGNFPVFRWANPFRLIKLPNLITLI